MRILLAVLLASATTACLQTEPRRVARDVPVSQQIAEGRDIASHQCANCHGLDDAEALRGDAMPLRHVLSAADSELLKANFETGLKMGHPDMPHFVFGPLGTDVLLTYLESIQEDPSLDLR